MDDLSQSLRILELEGPVPEDELKRAYRDLVKVWHPDRFEHDEKLRQLAEKKLREINGAYEILLANLFAESPAVPDATASSPPPPTPAENPPAAASKRSIVWTCLIIVLASLAVIWGLVWKYARHLDRPLPPARVVAESTLPSPEHSQVTFPPAAQLISNTASNTPDRSEAKPAPILPVMLPGPSNKADANQRNQAPITPGYILADYVYTVADDFVVDVFQNGKRVPDDHRKLINDTYGAAAEKIEVTVHQGDWLVFNVVKNRFRWDGQSCFVVAGMRRSGAIGFVSELQNGQWSCCDDPADAAQFIAAPDYLASNRVRPIARLWGQGLEQMKGLAKNWHGQPIWGTNGSTWIKFRAPRGNGVN
jgi:hypothetical protein